MVCRWGMPGFIFSKLFHVSSASQMKKLSTALTQSLLIKLRLPMISWKFSGDHKFYCAFWDCCLFATCITPHSQNCMKTISWEEMLFVDELFVKSHCNCTLSLLPLSPREKLSSYLFSSFHKLLKSWSAWEITEAIIFIMVSHGNYCVCCASFRCWNLWLCFNSWAVLCKGGNFGKTVSSFLWYRQD